MARTRRLRLLAACACAGICAGGLAATKCVTGGWPVADASVCVMVAATPAAGGASASSGMALETRVRTWAAADDFALDTRPARGVCILIR